MYRRYFNLNKKPFQITSDNQFLWLGPGHAKALKLLKKGMTLEQGVMMLTGDVGTGKTTLINEIIHTLDPDILVARIEDPGYEMHDLLKTVARAFGFEEQLGSEHPFSSAFLTFLEQLDTEGKKALVVVDESQRIPLRFLREIISWFNPQSDLNTHQVLNIILAGQLEFLEILEEGLGKAWPDHINVHVSLAALDRYETAAYIRNRLKIAGTQRELFDPSAIKAVHEYSRGIPRVINISCDQAMIQAFADGRQTINEHTFKAAVQSLELPLNSASSSTFPLSPAVASVHSSAPEKNVKDTGTAHPSGKENIDHKSNRSVKKLAVWVTAACICLVLAYGFYIRQPISQPAPEQLASKPRTVQTPSVPETEPEKESLSTEITLNEDESRTPEEDPAPLQKKVHDKKPTITATTDPDLDTSTLEGSVAENPALTDPLPSRPQPKLDEPEETNSTVQIPLPTHQQPSEEKKPDESIVMAGESQLPLKTSQAKPMEDASTQPFPNAGEELPYDSEPDTREDISSETEKMGTPVPLIAADSTPENQLPIPPDTEQTDAAHTTPHPPEPVISEPVISEPVISEPVVSEAEKTGDLPPEPPETKPSLAVPLEIPKKREKIDMDEFIKEVFSFKETPLSSVPSPETVLEGKTEEVSRKTGRSSEKVRTEPLKTTHPEKPDFPPTAPTETEPSPDAFIEWLINKKKKN